MSPAGAQLAGQPAGTREEDTAVAVAVAVAGYGGGQREMHPAVCAQCGIDTEVPFLPRGDKPVYCSDCFSSMRR